MSAEPFVEQQRDSDAADHLDDARRRARQMLSGEAHLGAVDDWRRALVSARDAVILIWITWVVLYALHNPVFTGWLLTSLAVALALLIGISTGRSTYLQVQYYAAEFERERREIREHFEDERDEVRALYAAKGFQDPLLGQIVDTLCADDDRLLKVMMEEELGLSMHHINHPLVVGLWNFAGAMIAGLLLALPVAIGSERLHPWWVPVGGSAIMLAIALVAAATTRRSTIEFFAVSVVMAVVTGGVAYFLSQWMTTFVAAGVAR